MEMCKNMPVVRLSCPQSRPFNARWVWSQNFEFKSAMNVFIKFHEAGADLGGGFVGLQAQPPPQNILNQKLFLIFKCTVVND